MDRSLGSGFLRPSLPQLSSFTCKLHIKHINVSAQTQKYISILWNCKKDHLFATCQFASTRSKKIYNLPSQPPIIWTLVLTVSCYIWNSRNDYNSKSILSTWTTVSKTINSIHQWKLAHYLVGNLFYMDYHRETCPPSNGGGLSSTPLVPSYIILKMGL